MRKDPKQQWRDWYQKPENRALVLAQKKAYRTSPETRPTHIANLRRQNLRKIGWTPEEFERSWADQNAACAICRVGLTRDISATGAASDHCHKTMRRRQLLCMLCNKGVGNFRDSVDLLRAAIEYLERHS